MKDFQNKKGEHNNGNKKLDDNKYKNGDVFAYKLEGDIYKEAGVEGQYLIFRKVDDYKDNRIYENIIVYVQITNNYKLPKDEEELNELDYIVMVNIGNVRHEYRMVLENIPKRKKKEYFTYIGNFPNLRVPQDEYKERYLWICPLSNIKYIIKRIGSVGTEKHPIYCDIDPKNIEEPYIRFLMRAKYYREKLKMEVPAGTMVKDSALLYVAYIDSLMIDGFVINPVGIVNEETKKEAYSRINELKDIINNMDAEDKEERLEVLNKLEEKLKNYEPVIVYKIRERMLIKNKNDL